MVFGISENCKHLGERLSRQDRDHAAITLLKERPTMSNVAIAELAACSDKTVAKLRDRLESTSEIPRLETRIGADGRTRTLPPSRVASSDGPPWGEDLEPIKDICCSGHTWMSDGEGGRFCENCHADYSEGLPCDEGNDDVVPSVQGLQCPSVIATKATPTPSKSQLQSRLDCLIKLHHKFHREVTSLGAMHPSPFCKQVRDANQAVDEILKAWRNQ